MNFDFTSADQRQVLGELQAQGYTLLGYKGALGPNQISVGVPTWFAVPFGHIFGSATIDYTPTYKVYVSNKANIAAGTTIDMDAMSFETGLGNALTFNQDGSFSSGGVLNVPASSIGLFNNRPAGTPQVTVGLAGLVNTPNGEEFLPFCAFTLNPQSSLIMTPLENILLVAAQLNLQSGNVQANLAAPGCTFTFGTSVLDYDLKVLDSTFQITNVPGTTSVTPVASGNLVSIVNSTSSASSAISNVSNISSISSKSIASSTR
ncbi:hypothetical protein ACLESO_05650 [Pyxidicoccus sp. 3LG]